MLIIKQGKKLNRAWKLYVCNKCGERGITLKKDAAAAIFPRIKVSDILIESDKSNFKPEECANCGSLMTEPSLFAEKYKEVFCGLGVILTDNDVTHVITEDELYY